MEQFSIRAFLAGLAMFVFGMHTLEDGIQDIGYQKLKNMVSRTINTKIKAMRAGTVLAGVLQSGTIVSTMVIAFAGAGLISLAMGVGVIVGSNVGGTFLGVIIAKLGFDYSISTFALPLLGVGGVMQFIQNKTVQKIGKLILAFGLLLFGIGYLKDSVSILANSLDIAKYADMGWYVFFFGGTVLAALLHSSGTTTIIAMTAMTAGILSFEQAIIVMLGASIGSSLISLYVSIGGSPIKRQIAYTHVGFNALGAFLFLPFVRYVPDIMSLFGIQKTGPDMIARFQVVYNVVAAIIVYPFIGLLVKLMQRYIGTKDESHDYQLKSIHENESESYRQMLGSDVLVLLKKIFKFNIHHLDIDQKILINPDYTKSEKYYATYKMKNEKFVEDYEILRTIEEGLLQGLLKRLHETNDQEDKVYIPYYEAIAQFIYSAKALDDVREDIILLNGSKSLIVRERIQNLKEHMIDFYVTISQVIDDGSVELYNEILQDHIKEIKNDKHELIRLLGKYIHRQPMIKGELSALLHLSGSLHRSHKAIAGGLEKLLG